MRRATRPFWLLFALTLAIYLVMVGWSLPKIAADAGGLVAFDLRPAGYSHEEARAFLTMLSAEGTDFYLDVQHRLDLAYPALLAATLFFAVLLLTPARWGWLRWLLALVAVPAAVFDYLENGAVASMLEAGAGGLTAEMVEAASFYTRLKSLFGALSMTIVLVLLGIWTWRRYAGARSG